MNIKVCCSASEMAGIKALAKKLADIDILEDGLRKDEHTYIIYVEKLEDGYYEIRIQLNSKFMIDYLDLLLKHSELFKKATESYINVLLTSKKLKEDFQKFTIDFCKKYVM